jgi:ParB/RepB/Spo0J family partition protein
MAKKTAAKAAAKKTKRAPEPAAPAVLADTSEILRLAYRQLLSSPHNPRKTFAPEALRELAESIAQQGLLQNLVVRPVEALGRGNGHTKVVSTGEPLYEIGAGERRWRAIGLLVADGRWDPAAAVIACKVVSADDAGFRAIALLENLQRQDVPPMEEAEGFAALRALDPDMWTTKFIAERIGKTQRYVQQRLALVEKLDDKVKDALREGDIELTQARALVHAPAAKQRELLQKIERGAWGTDAETIERGVLEKLPLVTTALFDLALYTGEIADGEPPHGKRDGRRFLDKKQFDKLQRAEIDKKKERLEKQWPWVEIVRGYADAALSQYGGAKFKLTKDKKKAGAVIFVASDGTVEVKTGLAKVEQTERQRPAERDWQAEQRAEAERRAARDAAASAFLAELAPKVAAEPALMTALSITRVLGAGPAASQHRGAPGLAGWQSALGPFVRRSSGWHTETGLRLVESANPRALLDCLCDLPNVADLRHDLWLTTFAVDNWRGIDPMLAAVAERLGVAVPEILRGLLRQHDHVEDEEEPPVVHCRQCGCSEEDACRRADGVTCSWVEADLCSACAPAIAEKGRCRECQAHEGGKHHKRCAIGKAGEKKVSAESCAPIAAAETAPVDAAEILEAEEEEHLADEADETFADLAVHDEPSAEEAAQ